MCVSEALAETGGGDSLPVGRLRLLSPRGVLRVFSSSSVFPLSGIAYRAALSVAGSKGLYTSRFIVASRIRM
jgi:hypothetical protein